MAIAVGGLVHRSEVAPLIVPCRAESWRRAGCDSTSRAASGAL